MKLKNRLTNKIIQNLDKLLNSAEYATKVIDAQVKIIDTFNKINITMISDLRSQINPDYKKEKDENVINIENYKKIRRKRWMVYH